MERRPGCWVLGTGVVGRGNFARDWAYLAPGVFGVTVRWPFDGVQDERTGCGLVGASAGLTTNGVGLTLHRECLEPILKTTDDLRFSYEKPYVRGY